MTWHVLGKFSASSNERCDKRWRVSWRASWREYFEKTSQKPTENLEKSVPEPSKIDARGLQNRARSLPRRIFYKTCNLRRFKRATLEVFWGHSDDFGAILVPQDPPKLRPKREKINVEKSIVFCIDFWRVRTSFWKGFW